METCHFRVWMYPCSRRILAGLPKSLNGSKNIFGTNIRTYLNWPIFADAAAYLGRGRLALKFDCVKNSHIRGSAHTHTNSASSKDDKNMAFYLFSRIPKNSAVPAQRWKFMYIFAIFLRSSFKVEMRQRAQESSRGGACWQVTGLRGLIRRCQWVVVAAGWRCALWCDFDGISCRTGAGSISTFNWIKALSVGAILTRG